MRAGGQQARQGANLEILPQLGPRDGPGRVTSACDKQQSQPAKGGRGGGAQPGNSANKGTRGQLSSMYRSRATNMKGGPRGALPRRARCRRAPPRMRHHDGRAVYSKQQLGGGHDGPERKPRADLVVSPFWPARTPQTSPRSHPACSGVPEPQHVPFLTLPTRPLASYHGASLPPAKPTLIVLRRGPSAENIAPLLLIYSVESGSGPELATLPKRAPSPGIYPAASGRPADRGASLLFVRGTQSYRGQTITTTVAGCRCGWMQVSTATSVAVDGKRGRFVLWVCRIQCLSKTVGAPCPPLVLPTPTPRRATPCSTVPRFHSPRSEITVRQMSGRGVVGGPHRGGWRLSEWTILAVALAWEVWGSWTKCRVAFDVSGSIATSAFGHGPWLAFLFCLQKDGIVWIEDRPSVSRVWKW